MKYGLRGVLHGAGTVAISFLLMAMFMFVSIRAAGAPISIAWFLNIFGSRPHSHYHPEPLLQAILARFPWTLELIVGSFVLAALMALAVAALSMRAPASLRGIAENLALPIRCIPYLWLALEGALVVIVHKGTLGGNDLSHFDLRDWAVHLLNPAVCLALFQLPFYSGARSLRDVLRSFARALPEILGAVVITETIFAWPGVGRLFYVALAMSGSLSFAVALILVAALAVLLVRAAVSDA